MRKIKLGVIGSQEQIDGLQAKVSELESLVAGLGDALQLCGKDSSRKALADTAKIAKTHDAGVRSEVWEEAAYWVSIQLKPDKHLQAEFEAKAAEAKATEARTEADATEKGEGS